MPDGRKPLISGNWKMNHNHFEAIQTVQKLAYRLKPRDFDAVDVSIHPPFTDIRSVQTVLDADEIPIAVGAQNCHWEDHGPFTGEVSPTMLAKLGVSYVIVGHSERRQLFCETDEIVAKKAKAVVKYGMTPIVCVGETLTERDQGQTAEKVRGQVLSLLEAVTKAEAGGIVIAYEPIWAIGTGRNASPEDAEGVCAAIRTLVGERRGEQAAAAVRIQYGGSVKPASAREILDQPNIDGALVGGASLDPDDFSQIIREKSS